MKIVMLTTQTGSRTGVLAEQFHAGQQYDLTGTAGERDLAAVFVREGWAREALDEPAADGEEAAQDQSDGQSEEVTNAQVDGAQVDGASRRKRSAAK